MSSKLIPTYSALKRFCFCRSNNFIISMFCFATHVTVTAVAKIWV